MMQQLKYKNARTALRGEMTHLDIQLMEARKALERFSNPHLLIHERDELLTVSTTYLGAVRRIF